MLHPPFQRQTWVTRYLDMCSVQDVEMPVEIVGEYRFILKRVNF